MFCEIKLWVERAGRLALREISRGRHQRRWPAHNEFFVSKLGGLLPMLLFIDPTFREVLKRFGKGFRQSQNPWTSFVLSVHSGVPVAFLTEI